MIGREICLYACVFIALAVSARAEIVQPNRIIKAQDIISAADLTLVAGDNPMVLADPQDAIGMEARVTLYAGRPIRLQDIAEPAVVDRNQMVEMIYSRGALSISAEGRSLDRAALGETIRVMNSSSRITVSARVTAPGQVKVLLK